MEKLNLAAVINGYYMLINNIPDEFEYEYPNENPDYDYEDILNEFYGSINHLFEALIKTKYFAFYSDNSHHLVKIFSTSTERNSYVNSVLLDKDTKNEEIECYAISYDDFIDYAQGNENNLAHYYCDQYSSTIDFTR